MWSGVVNCTINNNNNFSVSSLAPVIPLRFFVLHPPARSTSRLCIRATSSSWPANITGGLT